MAAAELDVPQLSSFCTLSPSSITTLLDAPTAELVRSLLQNISTKAREFKELESEKLKAGVEIENAVRGQESKIRVQKTQLGKANAELTSLRQQVEAAGSILFSRSFSAE